MRSKILLIMFTSIILSNQNTMISGNLEYFFMNRLSNSDVVNIPFRLLNLNIYHQRDNIDINGEFAVEYRPRLDTDFSFDDNPTDFNLVLKIKKRKFIFIII